MTLGLSITLGLWCDADHLYPHPLPFAVQASLQVLRSYFLRAMLEVESDDSTMLYTVLPLGE